MTTYTATFERDPVTGGADDLQSGIMYRTFSPKTIDREYAEWLLKVNQRAADWGGKWNANVKITITKNETIKVGEYHMGSDKVIWEDV